jgi:PadR family transcriptional regulator AphA
MCGVTRDRTELSLGERVCLALVAERPQHGWALVRELAPGGEIGRVWALSRPLTYRAVEGLLQRGLVAHGGEQTGGGPTRQVLRITPAGRRSVDRWLVTPVEHLRDVRTELLLKLVLAARRDRDPRPLLRAQRVAFVPHYAALQAARRRAGADDVDRWRYESSVAVRRFLDAALRAADAARDGTGTTPMSR